MSKTEPTTITQNEQDKARKKMLAIGTKGVGYDILFMVKSRFRILYICTPEETRVMNYFRYLSKAESYDIFQWDCARGLLDGHSLEMVLPEGNDAHVNPEAILRHIVDRAKADFSKISQKRKPKGSIFILLDYHRFLQSEDRQSEGSPIIQRLLKEFAQIVSASMLVIVSPVLALPATLEKEITVVDFPFPSTSEIKQSLLRLRKQIPAEYPEAIKQVSEKEEELVQSVSGLTLVEAENAFAKSLVKKKAFDIDVILNEKKQIIRKSGVLEYRDPKYSMDDIGGMDNLRNWILQRKLAFKEDAREFGLPAPKGVLLLGTPGVGKSMFCDAIAAVYQMPLLRLDFGAIFASHVGQSERNIRQCLKVAEAVAPCVLGDTIITINGLKRTIQSYFQEELEKARNEVSVFKDGDKITQTVVYLNKDEGATPFVSGFDGVKPSNLIIKAVIKTSKKEKLLRIKTKSGKQITVTKDHLLMDANGKIRKAKAFNKKDGISVYSNLIDEIESIEEIDFDGNVYDVSCEDPHLYITNDFISHNCVLWIDEVEKAVSGSSSSAFTDGGVTARVFGTLLTWMQEKEQMVFVACTANNVFAIPPEFMRAGRFDEVFFLDLPDSQQRHDITEKLLLKKRRNPDEFEIERIVQASDHYAPVEIEKGIDNALFVAYADKKRMVTTDDVVSQLEAFSPLYNTRKEEIESLRNWALGDKGVGGRARLANSPSSVIKSKKERLQIPDRASVLDLQI